ncbi:MAG TPA: PAS domain-containing protein, partial [Cyanophyceae cyanobacterium]
LIKLYENMIPSEMQVSSFFPIALKELGTTSEELQVAAEELLRQTDIAANLHQQLQEKSQRYEDLLEFIPDAYLVTDPLGKILEANSAAARLLNLERNRLLGKLLINFIPIERRSAFRSKLSQIQQGSRIYNYTESLRFCEDMTVDAAITVAPIHNLSSEVTALRWILRDITPPKPAQLTIYRDDDKPTQSRANHLYFKKDVIPLEPEQLWIVRHGLVKLSTINDYGEEVVVGLVGSSMVFGSSLTELPTYQAVTLSEQVELTSFSLSEINASPRLAQTLFPKISQRLRQTESLLAISGRRRVKDRLYYLLLFLKERFGQEVLEGVRLSIRLTHQDIADACCTTRVTITRELGKLQKQKIILFDAQNRMVFTKAWHGNYPKVS